MTTSDIHSASRSWLLCRIGHASCALPLDHVIEVFRPLPIKHLADAPRPVLGLSIIRGMPLAVVDIAGLIGAGQSHPRRMVTLRTGSRSAALVVDAVFGVRSFDLDSADALPPLLRDAAGDLVSAIGTLDSELLLLLRAARIVPDTWPEPAAMTGGAS